MFRSETDHRSQKAPAQQKLGPVTIRVSHRATSSPALQLIDMLPRDPLHFEWKCETGSFNQSWRLTWEIRAAPIVAMAAGPGLVGILGEE